jgi:hypothetical protein
VLIAISAIAAALAAAVPSANNEPKAFTAADAFAVLKSLIAASASATFWASSIRFCPAAFLFSKSTKTALNASSSSSASKSAISNLSCLALSKAALRIRSAASSYS